MRTRIALTLAAAALPAVLLGATAATAAPRPVAHPYNVEVSIGRKDYVTHCEHGIRFRKEYTFAGCTRFKVYG